jgi:dethiobiotin synthetase
VIAIGVTGTDTGVGKTVVSCAIVAAAVRRGLNVGVLKPVETGVDHAGTDSDAGRLAAAAQTGDSLDTVAPFTFPAPLAPMVAARRAAVAIDVEQLDRAFDGAGQGRDAVVVEGAGGLLVPITAELAFDALFLRWSLGVVVVAADRLGVINHARLTVGAAQRAGLSVRALVLNAVPPGRHDASTGANYSALAELMPGIPVVEFPWLPDASDGQTLAAAAERAGLPALLGFGERRDAMLPSTEDR